MRSPMHAVFDDDVAVLEGSLDTWTSTLKREVLVCQLCRCIWAHPLQADFSKVKANLLVQKQEQVEAERARCQTAMRALEREAATLKELLATYELNLQKKDSIIQNLTEANGREVRTRAVLPVPCDLTPCRSPATTCSATLPCGGSRCSRRSTSRPPWPWPRHTICAP
jgi:hypothetical protein